MSNRYTQPLKSYTRWSGQPPGAQGKSAPHGTGPRPNSWGAARTMHRENNPPESAPQTPHAAAACPPRADGLRHSRRALKDKGPTRARSRGGLRRRLAQPVPGNAPAQACRSAVLCARGQRRAQPGENQHPAPPRISSRAQRPAAKSPAGRQPYSLNAEAIGPHARKSGEVCAFRSCPSPPLHRGRTSSTEARARALRARHT
jgi:hypothetical protein